MTNTHGDQKYLSNVVIRMFGQEKVNNRLLHFYMNRSTCIKSRNKVIYLVKRLKSTVGKRMGREDYLE